MKNKRKLKIAAISLAAIAVVGIGAFAYFSDWDDDEAEGTVGTVDAAIDGRLAIENSENINPGDEYPVDPDDPDSPSIDNPTSGHAMTFAVENKGTKSIATRNIIDIDVTQYYETTTDENGKVVLVRDGSGDYIPLGTSTTIYLDPTVFSLYARSDADVDGRWYNYDIADWNDQSGNEDKYVYKGTYDFTDDNGNEGVMLRYVIEGATLNGSVLETDDSTTEDDDTVTMSSNKRSASYTYYLGLSNESDDRYQGAEVTVHLMVQALQYRNTNLGSYADDGDWTTVYDDVVTMQLP